MTDRPTFGRIADPDSIPDLAPKAFDLVGYDVDQEEVQFTFHARPFGNFGSLLDLGRGARVVDGEMQVPFEAAIRYIEGALLTECRSCATDDEPVADDLLRFRTTLHRSDLFFHMDTLKEIANWLSEVYGERPFQSRSERRSGRSTGGGTSTVEHNGRVSTSVASGPPTA